MLEKLQNALKGDVFNKSSDDKKTSTNVSQEKISLNNGDLVSQHIPSTPVGLNEFILVDDMFRFRSFGRIAIESEYLKDELVEALINEQKTISDSGKQIKIGALAVRNQYLPQDKVDEILASQKIPIYVDERYQGNPRFLTWIQDIEKTGVSALIIPTDSHGLARLRDNGLSALSKNVDQGLVTLNAAKMLITECAALRGSDMHILVRERFAEVQLRIKGELKVVSRMTRFEGESMIRAIYTGLASIKESMLNPFEFQDAQISGESLPGAGLTSIRIIRGPCYPVDQGGSFMVARLQYKPKKSGDVELKSNLSKKVPTIPDGQFNLSKMGYTPLQIDMLEKMTRMSSGIVLITGPTGSGKTSTLFELMAHQARQFPGVRQITVENPVEYPMSWAVQLPVMGAKNDEESGAGYLNMVRMTLRMDPDVILFGEIRGADEAMSAINAAMTGHLVWTTIHVTDPYMSIDRMENLDRQKLSRNIVCDHKLIRGIVAQRLVSVLCPKCKKTYEEKPEALQKGVFENIQKWHEKFKRRGTLPEDHKLHVCVRGDGCAHCGGDGIVGAKAVAEVVSTSPALMQDMIKQGTEVARRNNREKEGTDYSMLGNAVLNVVDGNFDPLDVERSIDIICDPEEE